MRRKCSILPMPLLNLGGRGVHFDATYSYSASVYSDNACVGGGDVCFLHTISYRDYLVLFLLYCRFPELSQPVIKCLCAQVFLFAPSPNRLTARLIFAIHHFPVSQFYLLFRFRYLIHSNQLQSGLKTSSDPFGFSLSLLLLLFKPRGGLADTQNQEKS